MSRTCWIRLTLTAFVVVLADQALKAAMLYWFRVPEGIQLKPIVLAAVKNTVPRLGVDVLVPVIIWFIVFGVVCLLGRGRNWNTWFAFGVMFALVGTGSNIVNWIVPGYVVDYIWVPAWGIVFNFADLVAVGGWLMAATALVVQRLRRKGCERC